MSTPYRYSCLLLLFLFPSCVVAKNKPQSRAVLTATNPLKPVPKVSTPRVIVMDYSSGKVLYSKNAHKKCAVASTQKLLTALCVLEAGSLSNKVYVQATDTYVEPSKLYIKPGEIYTRSDLLKALLIKSGNDVARALARDVAGSQVRFRAKMNNKAKRIGMRSSYFYNAHGLTEGGQYSTAYDLALLAREAYRNPTIRSFTKIKSFYFKPSKSKHRWIKNTNRLLRTVPFCNGLKTGTTRAAGRCLIASGQYNGRSVIIVCLGATSKTIWSDSEKLLRWALVRPKAVNH